MAGSLAIVVFDGFAFGMLLFVLSVGLSVTLGLMGFINLAHGAFAMLGAYVTVVAMREAGLPFLAALPLAFLASALVSVVFERLFFRRLYRAGELNQVLFTIGLVFVAAATMAWLFGTGQQPIQMPAWLRGSVEFAGQRFGIYRMFLIVVALAITLLLFFGLERTRFGARVRAAVDNQRVAQGLGLDVERIFALTFAIGSGLAGLGGALAIEIVGLDPSFGFHYLVYVLIVVAVGGLGSVGGSFAAAAILGIGDVAGKYLVPELGSFLIYLLLIGILFVRPQGLFGETLMADISAPRAWLASRSRWSWYEIAFWAAALIPFFLFPTYLSLASQIAIVALFALSVDLVLGYAGIVTLGHAMFFGLGAYCAGLISKGGWGEPLTGLLLSAAFAGLVGFVASFLIVRVQHLALLMITLGLGLLTYELANSLSWLTGGTDGLRGVDTWPVFGVFKFDLWGYTAYGYALAALFVGFLISRRIVNSSFGLALRGVRENVRRMPAIGSDYRAHLQTIYTISAAMAGAAGALLTQTTDTVSLDTLSFQRSADVVVMLILGGTGRLYGAILGALIFMLARDQLAGMNPQYWYFWIGLLLMVVVLVMPRGILGGLTRLVGRRDD